MQHRGIGGSNARPDDLIDDVESILIREPIGKVPHPQHWVESNCIEVKHLIGVPGLLQSFRESLEHSMAKGLRVRMGVDG